MKKFTKSLLTFLLVFSLVASHFMPLTNVYAAEDEVTITIDVNGGNELYGDKITGTKGNTLDEIIGEQAEAAAWIDSLINSRKQRTYMIGIVDVTHGETLLNPEEDPITEDITIRFNWENSELYSDPIEIRAEAPRDGDIYTVDDEIGFTIQDPSALIDSEDEHFFDYFDIPMEQRIWMVNTCQELNSLDCLEPFEGTIVAGDTYYLMFVLSINDQYYMTNNVQEVLTVNGAAPDYVDAETYENGDFKIATVIVEMTAVEGQGGGPSNPDGPFQITFVTNGGTPVPESIQVNDGDVFNPPEPEPTKENKVFAGWYDDEGLTHLYDFGDPVHEPRTLYAKWEDKNISLSANPSSINFGEVHVSPEDDIQRQVTITNTGNVKITLSIDNPTADGPFGTLGFNEVQLEPTQSTDITLIINKNAFQIATAGDYAGNYVLTATEVGGEGTGTTQIPATVKLVEDAPQTHTVTFNADGGTPVPEAIEVNHGASISKPTPDPYKENYEFDVWCSDETKTTPYEFTNSVTSDLTLYARYREAQASPISLVPNTLDFGTVAENFENDVERTITITNNGNQDMNLYIGLPENKPFVVRNFNNGSVLHPGENLEVTFAVDHTSQNKAVGEYNEVFNIDYEIAGGGFRFELPATLTIEEVTAPPVEKVTVTFDADGGTPVPEAQEIDKGAKATQPTTNPEKENYEFAVWCSDETKTTPYDFSQPVNGDITLYAKYNEIPQGGEEPLELKVTVTPLEVNFGTFTIGSESDLTQTVTVNNESEVAVEVQVSSPVNEGPFGTLNTASATIAAGESTTFTLIVNHNAQKASEPGTYNGQYVFSYNDVGQQLGDEALISVSVTVVEPVEKVTVTFNTDGGTPVPEAQEIDKGATATQPTTNPEKENYEFDVWCSDETKTTPYDFTQPVNGDITLYARYTEVQQGGEEPPVEKVTVTFNTDGGTPVPEAQEIDKGAKATQPTTNPEKENYEFDVWCSDESKTTQYDFTQPVNGDITLYARYTEVQQGGEEPEVTIIDNTNNQEYNPTESTAQEGLTIKVSGDLVDLQKIEVDNTEINKDDSTIVVLTQGSTIAKFTDEFLATLAPGTHTVKFTYPTGSATATFTILGAQQNPAPSSNPSTYDNIVGWFELLGVSILGIGAAIIVRKKLN